ncbi:MAG: hypothetical protein CMD20_03410 [Flavobacteriales bacterium]|nr:hypothetical protein [Flavobacteriales bacterium]
MKEGRKKNIDRLNGKDSYLRLEELFLYNSSAASYVSLQTLDELMARDNQREEDGFERKIKLGKIVRPSKNGSDEIIIVPSTIETKFYHDNAPNNEEEEFGGTGTEEEGTVIGEKSNNPKNEEGTGQGPGDGAEKGHDLNSDAYNLGKVLTEYFNLPRLKKKGMKKSLSQYNYELTDLNKGFGQLIDKKQTLKRIIKTNILLNNIPDKTKPDLSSFIHSPQDTVYKILSREISYETEAIVFFVRDYSGSMQGSPSEAVLTQHLFLYSWLMYQYDKKVKTRFILHDTQAIEVEDFNTYYRSNVAGGTKIFPAFELVNSIIENEQLHLSKNIYVFYGSDGDDWKDNKNNLVGEIKKLSKYANRIGIFVARNSGNDNPTSLETTIEESNILSELHDTLKITQINSRNFTENQIIESIKLFLTV